MVVLELALMIPVLLLVCVVGAWLLRLGQVQAQLDDATRAAAREYARGADSGEAAAAAARVLPGVRVDAAAAPAGLSVTGRYHLAAPLPALPGLGAHLNSSLVTAVETGDAG